MQVKSIARRLRTAPIPSTSTALPRWIWAAETVTARQASHTFARPQSGLPATVVLPFERHQSTHIPSPTFPARARRSHHAHSQLLGLGSQSLRHTRAFSLWPARSPPNATQTDAVASESMTPLTHQASVNDAAPITSGSLHTASVQPLNAAEVPPNASQNLAGNTLPEAAPSPADSLPTPSDLVESVNETHRTLSDYGLGDGFFTGPVQHLLEWTHITTGLPWWATIGLVVITVRVFLFPVMVSGIANNARLARIQPQMLANINEIKAIKADPTASPARIYGLQQDTAHLLRSNNCNPLRGLIAPLLQMPLFITFFFSLRGMASAGLPDFATGGLSWFTDLSVPDPYYILPVLSGVATLAVLQVGEYGMPEATGAAKTIRNGIKMCLPLIIYFTSSFPAAVLVYWVTHNTFSVLQSLVLRLQFFKTWANIPDPLPKDASKSQSGLGFVQAFKDTREAFSDMKTRAAEKDARGTEERNQRTIVQENAKERRDRKAAELRRLASTTVANAVPQGQDGSAAMGLLQKDSKSLRVDAARQRRESRRTQKPVYA